MWSLVTIELLLVSDLLMRMSYFYVGKSIRYWFYIFFFLLSPLKVRIGVCASKRSSIVANVSRFHSIKNYVLQRIPDWLRLSHQLLPVTNRKKRRKESANICTHFSRVQLRRNVKWAIFTRQILRATTSITLLVENGSLLNRFPKIFLLPISTLDRSTMKQMNGHLNYLIYRRNSLFFA